MNNANLPIRSSWESFWNDAVAACPDLESPAHKLMKEFYAVAFLGGFSSGVTAAALNNASAESVAMPLVRRCLELARLVQTGKAPEWLTGTDNRVSPDSEKEEEIGQ